MLRLYTVLHFLLVLCWVEFSCCICTFKNVFVFCVLFENYFMLIIILCFDILFLALYLKCLRVCMNCVKCVNCVHSVCACVHNSFLSDNL